MHLQRTTSPSPSTRPRPERGTASPLFKTVDFLVEFLVIATSRPRHVAATFICSKLIYKNIFYVNLIILCILLSAMLMYLSKYRNNAMYYIADEIIARYTYISRNLSATTHSHSHTHHRIHHKSKINCYKKMYPNSLDYHESPSSLKCLPYEHNIIYLVPN